MAMRHGVRGVRVAAGRLTGPGRTALAAGAPRGGGRAAGGLRTFGGAFPATGGHRGWGGGPRWLSMKSTASAPERPGSGSGAGPGLASPSDSELESESESESSEGRKAAAAGAGEFDWAERRPEVRAEWEARGLVRREVWSSGCFGVAWDAQNGKWKGMRPDGGRRHVGLFDSERQAAAAVAARQWAEGLDLGWRQASEFREVAWHKTSQKWQATIQIGGKLRHLGYFGAGHPGEVDAALAFDTVVRALGPVGRSTNNASERTNFEVPVQGARGLSREQAADVEARLERHLRRVLLACKVDGGAKGLGEVFERQLPGQVMPAPAARGALLQHTVPARAPRGLMRPGAGRQGLSELVELLGLVEGGEPVEEETSRST
jgi:hypothetical protein